jgi:hypothetical protein
MSSMMRRLRLQRLEEALDRRVVVAVTPSAHTGLCLVLTMQMLVGPLGESAPAVGC